MKILHVLPYYKPAYVYGGPIYSSSALCEALFKKGHDITVLTTTANGDQELSSYEEVIDGVKVLRFNRLTKNNTFVSPQLALYLYRHIKSFDVVHVHTWWNLVSIFSLIICFLKKVRPVLSPRGMLSDYIIETNNPKQKKIIQWLFGKSLLAKVKFHATAPAESLEILKLYPSATIKIAFNFIKIPSIPNSEPVYDDTIKMIFLSRIDPKKGLELLFKALHNLNWNYHLDIIGPGTDEYIESLKLLTEQLGIGDHVTWHGSVFGDKKFAMLKNHDLMLLPSYNENFANVIIETLAMGTPVLISNEVGLAPYVSEKNLGWICHTNSSDIIKQLELFRSDLSKRNFIRKNAPAIIDKDFNHDVLVDKYLELYKL